MYVYVYAHSIVSWLFTIPWTVACQSPLSMGFFRQECWSGLPFSSLVALPHPGIGPKSPSLWHLLHLQADSLPLATWKSESEVSRVRLSATPWTVARQALLSMGFSRSEYWSGLPFPSPGDLPNPGIESRSPTLQVDSLPAVPEGKPLGTRPADSEILEAVKPVFKQSLQVNLMCIQLQNPQI